MAAQLAPPLPVFMVPASALPNWPETTTQQVLAVDEQSSGPSQANALPMLVVHCVLEEQAEENDPELPVTQQTWLCGSQVAPPHATVVGWVAMSGAGVRSGIDKSTAVMSALLPLSPQATAKTAKANR
jgi:hypothetical protein